MAALPHAFRGNEGTIAQRRWLRWAIWRSIGFEFGTEPDAAGGAENGTRVYVASYIGIGVTEKPTTRTRVSP